MPLGITTTVVEVIVCLSISSPIQEVYLCVIALAKVWQICAKEDQKFIILMDMGCFPAYRRLEYLPTLLWRFAPGSADAPLKYVWGLAISGNMGRLLRETNHLPLAVTLV
jgi:hypothetical protein